MANDRIIPLQEMAKLIGKSSKSIWRWWAKDGTFPKPIQRNGRTIGWPESVYRRWLSEQMEG